jgi:hypothetical protein
MVWSAALLSLLWSWTIACGDVSFDHIRSLSVGGVACVLIDGKGKDENKHVAELLGDVIEMIGREELELVRFQGTATTASYSLHEPSLRSPTAIHPHLLVLADGKKEVLLPLLPERYTSSFLVEYFRTLLYNSVTYDTLSSPGDVQRFLRDPRALRILRVANTDGDVSDCSSSLMSLDVSWWDQLCAHFLSNASVRMATTSPSFSPVPTAAGDTLVLQVGFHSEVIQYVGYSSFVGVLSMFLIICDRDFTVSSILAWVDSILEAERIFFVNSHNSFSFYNRSSTPSLTIFDPRVGNNGELLQRYYSILNSLRLHSGLTPEWKFSVSSFKTLKTALPGDFCASKRYSRMS